MDFESISSSIDEILNTFFSDKDQSVSKINKEVAEPHIRFKRDDLIRMIQLSASIINLKSTQVVPKSITIVCEDNNYKMIANNDLEYIEYKFNVLNEENRLVDTICLPIELIKSMGKMFDDEIIIFKSENSYFVRLLLEGDLYLELPRPEPALLRRPFDDIVKEDIEFVSQTHLLDALKALIPIVNDEVVLDRKKITFLKDRAYFMTRKFFMDYILPLPSMKISLRFADVLKRMILSYNSSKSVAFYKDVSSESRVVVICGDILFSSTVTRTPQETNKAVEYLDRVKALKHLVVDLKDIDRVVSIACNLPYSNREIELKYDKVLTINVSMKTRTTGFKVPCTEVGKVKSRSDIVISAENLKKLIDSFGGSGSASLVILDNCIVIGKGNLLGVLEI